MKYIVKTEQVEIPENVKVSFKAREITVTGPRGTLTKRFKHIKCELSIEKAISYETKQEADFVFIKSYLTTYKQSAVLGTFATLIKNMMTGVTIGYRYKMHIVKKHFPIEVSLEGDNLQIARFLGERVVKTVKLLPGVSFSKNEKNNEELWFEGNDVAAVSLTCAHVYQSCKVPDKDRRMFLDGIYVSEKTNIENKE